MSILAVDDAVLVGTPAWWRMVAMDGAEDGGDGHYKENTLP